MGGKLDQIIKDLLSKIPVIGERFKEEEYDEDETQIDGELEDEEDEEYEEDEEESDEGEEEDDAEAAKKKKKQLIIRGVIVLIVVYLTVDTLFLTDESGDQNVPQVQEQSAQQKKIAALRAKRQAQRKAAEAKKKAEELAKQKAAEEAAKLQAEQEAKQKADEEAAKKAAAEAEAQRLAEEQKKAEEAASAQESERDNAIQNVENTIEQGESSTPTEENSNVSDSDDNSTDMNPPSNDGSTSQIQSTEPEPQVDMIQKVDRYVAPPDYEILGRGLVYNCQKKYWACVDRKGYFQCRKNERWQKQNNKDLECHIFRVYATDKDCKTMQIYNINMNIPTDFCKASK